MNSEGFISFLGTLMSQIFVGLVLGFCWNTGMTELGCNPISPVGAVVLWFAALLIFFIFSFVNANMFKTIMVQGVVTVEPEKKSKGKEEPPPENNSDL